MTGAFSARRPWFTSKSIALRKFRRLTGWSPCMQLLSQFDQYSSTSHPRYENVINFPELSASQMSPISHLGDLNPCSSRSLNASASSCPTQNATEFTNSFSEVIFALSVLTTAQNRSSLLESLLCRACLCHPQVSLMGFPF